MHQSSVSFKKKTDAEHTEKSTHATCSPPHYGVGAGKYLAGESIDRSVGRCASRAAKTKEEKGIAENVQLV
jgi:hypothetical protein